MRNFNNAGGGVEPPIGDQATAVRHRASGPPPPVELPSDRSSPEACAARLKALEAFESDFHDLQNMAGITFHLLEDALGDPDANRQLTGGMSDVFYVPSSALDRIMFASAHTMQMVEVLKARYIAAMGLGREG